MRDNNALAAQRRAQASAIVIDNLRARAVRAQVEYQIAHARNRTSGSTLGLVLVGPPQTGKSTILHSIADELNARAIPGKTLPALYVTLDEGVTRKQLAQNILEALEEDYGFHTLPDERARNGAGNNEAGLLRRVRIALKALQTELLILDEFHHIKHRDSKKVAASVGETIKRMLIQGTCPIVMAGMINARLPYDENPQLAKRCLAPIELKKLNILEAEDMSLFIDFLDDYLFELEKHEIIKHARDLGEGDIPGGINRLTNGVLGDACNFLKHAIDEATWAGRDRVTRADLANAARKHFPTVENPFDGSPPKGIRETRGSTCVA